MKSKFRFLSLLSRLGKDKPASGPRLLARLLRDEDGAYLLYMVFVLPVLIGAAGLGTEAGLVFYNHRTLQSAADAAAYSAAIAYSNSTSANITTQAQAIVASYGFDLGTGTDQASVSVTPPGTFAGHPAITVSISRAQSTFFSGMYFPTFPIAVSAVAIIGGSAPGGTGNCLLALGNTATGNNAANSIHVQGSATMDMGQCGVFSNSTQCTSGDAVTIQGAGSLLAGSFGTAGCASGNGVHPANIGPPPNSFTQNDGPLSDPYAGTTIPTTGSPGSCSAGSCTPGVYSGGISLKGGSWTLSSGVYIISGGSFDVGPGGGGTIVRSGVGGVTLVFTSTSTGMNLNSKADVNLTALSTGPTSGFVLMGDYSMPLSPAVNFNITANANADFNGTVYLPNGNISWQGTADTALGCRQIIVNTISLQGNPALNANGCNSSGGGGGAGKPIGSIVTLVD